MRRALLLPLFWAALASGASARRPLGTAIYDGHPETLLDRLRAGKIERLVVVRGVTPVPVLSADAGVNVVELEPRALKSLVEEKSRGPVLIKGGKWPGLRSNIVYENDRDIGFAAATAEPWVDANGWMLLYARGVAPDAEPILTYDPAKGSPAKIGSTALAVAEAAAFGGAYALPAAALAAPSGPRAIADSRRTLAQLRFLEEHPEWFNGPNEASIEVLADNFEPIGEVMNLLIRRNLPFFARTRESRSSTSPAMLIDIEQPRDAVKNPSVYVAEVREKLGDRRPFRLSNAQQVIATVNDLPGGKRVMHLLNYGLDPIQDVRVLPNPPAAHATMFAPGESGGAVLPIRNGEFAVPEMAAYCAVLLE